MRTGELPIGCVLPRDAKNVAHQRRCCVPLVVGRNAEGAKLLAQALENADHRRPPRRSRKCRAYPGMRVDGVEYAERECADSCLGLGISKGSIRCVGDDGVGCRGEQLILAFDMPVDRS